MEVIIGFLVRFFFFQAEDGIRDLVRSRGLGDVYKRQHLQLSLPVLGFGAATARRNGHHRCTAHSRSGLHLSLIHI